MGPYNRKMRRLPESDRIRRAFARTVRKFRRERGISQERLALEAEIARGYMGTLERGKTRPNPTLETVLKILRVLGVSFEEFAREFERCLRRRNTDKTP